MEKLEKIFSLLDELTIEELDLVRLKTKELKIAKKPGKKSYPPVCGIRKSQKERMIEFNPFLKDKL